MSAAGLSLGIAELSKLAGDWQRLVIVVNIFTVGMVSLSQSFSFHVLFVKICWIQKPKMGISDIFMSGFLTSSVIDLIGLCATYAKIYPTLKTYEYGFRVFLITYCFITVSGYRTGEFLDTAINRFLLIALGAAVSLGVNICIYPIWAGEDLHNLVTENFIGVATSLEGILQFFIYHPHLFSVTLKPAS